MSAPLNDAGQAEARDATSGPAAFEAFFWRYERRVFGYLWRMTGDEQAAYDLSQETFLRAWQHFAEVQRHPDAGNWLFRVASNLALSHLRRRNAPVGAAQPLDAFTDPAASDPAGHFAERDLVRQMLLELTPQQRGALVLHEVYGLTCAEVGQTLGISRDAAKMALFRARAHFRRRYAEEDAR
jgi:RNA polymerase sigma-70 factor (ECF subfamily)